jgi:hypothetical protein
LQGRDLASALDDMCFANESKRSFSSTCIPKQSLGTSIITRFVIPAKAGIQTLSYYNKLNFFTFGAKFLRISAGMTFPKYI